MQLRLTKTVIEGLKPGPKQYTVWDESMPGFGIKVNPNSKSFVLQARVNGGTVFRTIGRYGRLTLEEAKREAKILFAKLELGEPLDPVDDKAKELTFKELGDEFIKYQSEEIAGRPRKKTWEKDKERLKLAESLNHLRLREVTSKVVLDLHRELSTKRVSQRWATGRKEKVVGIPGAANRLLACIRTMFNFALVQGYHPGPNPVNRLVKFNPERTREEMFLRPNQFPAFWEALNEEPNIYVRNLFMVILFAASRPEEVKNAKWSDIDLENGTWTKRDTKNGSTQVVPLTKELKEIFETTPKVSKNPYVFASQRSATDHVMNVQKNWKRLAKKAKLDGIVARDLRRTFTIYARECGYSREDVKSMLNHSSRHADVTERYSPMRQEKVRQAMQETTDYIMRLCAAAIPVAA